MSEQEKRRFVRIHFERQVQVDFFSEIYDQGEVKNISLGGVYISGQFPHQVGDKCHVTVVQRGNKTYLTLKALAVVVRSDDEGIGLQFTSMSFESLLSLEMILIFEAREKSPNIDMKLPEELPFDVYDESPCMPDELNTLLDQT